MPKKINNPHMIFGADYIIDFGENANGKWEKWASGKLIQKGSFEHTFRIVTPWGTGMFASSGAPTFYFPIQFLDGTAPEVDIDARTTTSTSALFGTYTMPGIYKDRVTNGISAFRGTASESVPAKIMWEAEGKWK